MKRREIVADNDVRGYCVDSACVEVALALCFLGLSIDLATATFYEFLCIMSDPTGIYIRASLSTQLKTQPQLNSLPTIIFVEP